MFKPTTHELEACARLRGQEPRFAEMLDRMQQLSIGVMVNHHDEVAVRQAQGAIQQLDILLDLIENAEKHLRQAQRNN